MSTHWTHVIWALIFNGFTSIYAVETIGLSNTQIGIVSTVGGLRTTILAFPGGMLSDRFGRKPMIVISRTVMPVSLLGMALSQNFQHYFTVQSFSALANALGGGGGGGRGRAGGPAW